MKRLLLVGLMIQVTLIGVSSAADVIGSTHRSLDAISYDQINVAGRLQAKANPTTEVSLDAINHDQISISNLQLERQPAIAE